MEASPSQPYSDCQKPSSAVVKKPSSSQLRDQQEQITPDVLQYVLFGSNPVKIVNIKSRFISSGGEKDSEFPPIRNDGEEAAVETDNSQSVKANMKLSYAVATFPDEVTLCLSSIPGTTFGVCAKQHIPVGTWIGPYEGKRVPVDQVSVEVNTSHMWEIYEENQVDYFLDGSDENTSSWMRYIRCARHKQEQNLFAFQHNNSIFYRAFRDIPRGCELLVWYEDSYTQHMGIPVEIGNQNSPLQLPEIGSRGKHHIALREARVRTLSGELDTPEDADSGSRPQLAELNRGQKRGSSSHSLLSMLYQETCKETSTHIFQRHLKRSRLEQEISKSNSLAYNDPAVRISRAGADRNKKPSTSETAGARQRRVIDDVFDNSGEGGEFKCGQCKTTFTQRSLLNSHLCSCMPCKPYRCGHCQEAFAQPKELRMHAMVHVSEKPFKCGYCLRAFSGATTLNNHVRTHTGEKPFLCERCGKSFSQAFQLSRHRRICLQHTD